MPFIESYIAADGGEHPQAYWTPGWVGLNLHGEEVTVTYAAYHDQAYWYSGGPPVSGAARPYTITGPACRDLIRQLLAIPGVAELLESLPLASGDFPPESQVPFPTPPPGPE